jgi:hypothetical protein
MELVNLQQLGKVGYSQQGNRKDTKKSRQAAAYYYGGGSRLRSLAIRTRIWAATINKSDIAPFVSQLYKMAKMGF